MLRLCKQITPRLRTWHCGTSTRQARHFSDDHADNNDAKQNEKKQHVQSDEDSAASRLNKLLASMQTEDSLTKNKSIDLPKPGVKAKKRREEAKLEAKSKDIFVAAQRVAEMLDHGKSNKTTEMELLSKLLNQKITSDSSDEAMAHSAEDQNLGDLMKSMKIEHKKHPEDLSRAEFVRRTLQTTEKTVSGKQQSRRGDQGQRWERKDSAGHIKSSVNLFGGEPMGIFKDVNKLQESTDICRTWQRLRDQDLQLQVSHPPSNYFEKVARWTEAGRVWHYPIDNEQGLEAEKEVDFTEHVFLEQHLEPWCPSTGPIRHFMELVCVGLSKNPYITAEEKRQHIFWYRDYFESKKDLLQELIKAKNAAETATTTTKPQEALA